MNTECLKEFPEKITFLSYACIILELKINSNIVLVASNVMISYGVFKVPC